MVSWLSMAFSSNRAASPIVVVSIFVAWSLVCFWFLFTRHDQARPPLDIMQIAGKIPSVKLQTPQLLYEPSKLALLIESKPLPHLAPLILHMMAVVPMDWRFLFLGSHESVQALRKSFAIKQQSAMGRLDLMTLPQPWAIESTEDVSRLMTDIRFYDEFLQDVEWLFKYEYDSILCTNAGKSLDTWLGWSWAGSQRSRTRHASGNGGLTLRRVSSVRRLLSSQTRDNDTEAEDEWFRQKLSGMPSESLPSGIDQALAVDTVLASDPMGYHAIGDGTSFNDALWKKADNRRKMLDYCPELGIIMGLEWDMERCYDDNQPGEAVPDDDTSTSYAEEGTDWPHAVTVFYTIGPQ